MTQDKTLRVLMGASAVLAALCIGVMLYERAGYSPPTFVPAAVRAISAERPGEDSFSAVDAATDGMATPAEVEQIDSGSSPEDASAAVAHEPEPDVQLVNINTAGIEILTTLPGIGPVIGQNIIDYRERVGGFSSVEQLIYVERIGEKTLEGLRPYVTV